MAIHHDLPLIPPPRTGEAFDPLHPSKHQPWSSNASPPNPHISKVLEELFTFTWKYKIAELSPTKKQQRITPWWPSIHEYFAALVFGGYMIETEKDGTKYCQLT